MSGKGVCWVERLFFGATSLMSIEGSRTIGIIKGISPKELRSGIEKVGAAAVVIRSGQLLRHDDGRFRFALACQEAGKVVGGAMATPKLHKYLRPVLQPFKSLGDWPEFRSWKSYPRGEFVWIFNPVMAHLMDQTEALAKLGYNMVGGLQLVTRADGRSSGAALLQLSA